MSLEVKIGKVEKSDIIAPKLETGASAIVFQRHERYERTHDAENAGSLLPDVTEEARRRDEEFFREVLSGDKDDSETMVLFVSSDTQYADKGYRSMETAQIAQDAAVNVMTELGIDPMERIINLNPNFRTDIFEPTGQSIRPDGRLREPQIFEAVEYVKYLKDMYGNGELNSDAWQAHEIDAAHEVRKRLGAESIYDMLDRTKKSLIIMEQYSQFFHAFNPGKKTYYLGCFTLRYN